MRIDTKIFDDLYKSHDGLLAYTFYTRYGIGPDKIFAFIEKNKTLGLVEYNDGRLYLTSKGKDYVLNKAISIKKTGGKYDNIPETFKGEKIGVNQPFLPTITDLSSEILDLRGWSRTSILEVKSLP